MKKDYLIKWTKKDYSNLRKAVNQFNKKLQKAKEMELGINLPRKLYYKDVRNKNGELLTSGVKSQIVTRKQLNQTISSLNRFNFKSALDKITLASGEKISRWEYQDIKRKQPIALSYIQKRLEEEYSKNPKDFKGLRNDKIKKLESTLSTIENFQNKEGEKLRYSLDRIRKIGNIDYEMKKAQTFKDNFMSALKEGASKFKNYKLFYNDLKKIKNPKEFYNFVKDSDTLMDLFVWYDDETGTMAYGSFKNNEEAFNNALINDFGYILDE